MACGNLSVYLPFILEQAKNEAHRQLLLSSLKVLQRRYFSLASAISLYFLVFDLLFCFLLCLYSIDVILGNCSREDSNCSGPDLA